MKSFFKKLAFVMAMAMVVSLAAPAAAQAADLPLYLAYQNETDKVEGPVVLAPEATVDFCFQGAQAGWRDLERGWVSSNPAVATVDSNGLVTAVAAGTATITFELAGYEDASVQVVVAEPVAKNEFAFDQISEKAFTLTYANDVEYTLDDVQLFIIYDNAASDEPIEIKWPIDKKNSKVEKNVITLTPFVEFDDGQTFKVVVDGVDKTKTVTLGEVDEVVINIKDNKSPYVYTNVEADDDFHLAFEIKWYSNGVDLTNYYDLDITWDITSTNKDATDFDEDEFKIYFSEDDLTASVQAKVKVAENKDIKSNSIPVYSVAQPDWNLVGVTDWAIIHKDTEEFNWSKSDDHKSVPADVKEEDYVIVLKLIDTRDGEYVTHEAGLDKDGKLEVWNIDDMDIELYSADTDLMLVDIDGYVGVYKETEAVFYVKLCDDRGDDLVEKYIYADTLAVTEGRRLDDISIKDNKTTLEVVTKTLDGYAKLATGSVTMEAVDQYDDAWANVTYKVDTDNDKVDEKKAVTVDGSTINVNGTLLAGLGVSSFKVTVTGEQDGVSVKPTATFTVTVKNPKIENDAIVVDTVTKTRHNPQPEVLLEVEDIDISAALDKETGDAYAEINLYQTSNDAIVGKYSGIEVLTSKAQTEEAQWTTDGARYITITKGDKYYDAFWEGDVLKLELATGDNDEMEYGETGDYTVKVVTVRYKKERDLVTFTTTRNDYVETEVIKVTNNIPEVKFNYKAKDVFTPSENAGDIVAETLAFTLGGKAWDKLTAAMITEVETVEVGDYIIIKSVTINVPIDGEDVNAPYYEVTVNNINVSVKDKNAQ